MNTFYWNETNPWIWILLFLFRTLLRLHHPNFLGNCKMQKIINVSVIITGDYKRLGESFVVYHRCRAGREHKRKAVLYSRAQLLIGCWLFTWSPVNRLSSCPCARNFFLFVNWCFPGVFQSARNIFFLCVNGVLFSAFPVDSPHSSANYCKGCIFSSLCSYFWPPLSFFLLLTNSPVFSETVRTEWESWFIHSIQGAIKKVKAVLLCHKGVKYLYL